MMSWSAPADKDRAEHHRVERHPEEAGDGNARRQLVEAIYRELNGHDLVVMTL